MVLHCGHTLCANCVLVMAEREGEGTIGCPECRARTPLDGALQLNVSLRDAIGALLAVQGRRIAAVRHWRRLRGAVLGACAFRAALRRRRRRVTRLKFGAVPVPSARAKSPAQISPRSAALSPRATGTSARCLTPAAGRPATAAASPRERRSPSPQPCARGAAVPHKAGAGAASAPRPSTPKPGARGLGSPRASAPRPSPPGPAHPTTPRSSTPHSRSRSHAVAEQPRAGSPGLSPEPRRSCSAALTLMNARGSAAPLDSPRAKYRPDSPPTPRNNASSGALRPRSPHVPPPPLYEDVCALDPRGSTPRAPRPRGAEALGRTPGLYDAPPLYADVCALEPCPNSPSRGHTHAHARSSKAHGAEAHARTPSPALRSCSRRLMMSC